MLRCLQTHTCLSAPPSATNAFAVCVWHESSARLVFAELAEPKFGSLADALVPTGTRIVLHNSSYKLQQHCPRTADHVSTLYKLHAHTYSVNLL